MDKGEKRGAPAPHGATAAQTHMYLLTELTTETDAVIHDYL